MFGRAVLELCLNKIDNQNYQDLRMLELKTKNYQINFLVLEGVVLFSKNLANPNYNKQFAKTNEKDFFLFL